LLGSENRKREFAFEINDMDTVNILWFRRDLRIHDNTALFQVLKEKENVLPIFIFDSDILSDFKNKYDRRINFIYASINELKKKLEKSGSSLLVEYGKPFDIFNKIISQYNVTSVYANEDYEPYSINRDEKIKSLLAKNKISFHLFKDQVIFSKNDVLKTDGKPYTVFTPYSKKWIEELYKNDLVLNIKMNFENLFKTKPFPLNSIDEIGFQQKKYTFTSIKNLENKIIDYHKTRDYPALDGTTHLGIHLRFGTISIRELIITAMKLNPTFLNELIWREFYMMILFHYPGVIKNSFKSKYDNIHWLNNEMNFERWCKGETGYPIVDAGMRQLNETGYMHNRLRMITASFLTKHLLIDWRWGEAYFAEKLDDYELASNNGGWQWSAGTGCDAAPYFRIFNPYEQTKKFDKNNEYIRLWAPESLKPGYIKPIVEHKFARQRCLEEYNKAVRN